MYCKCIVYGQYPEEEEYIGNFHFYFIYNFFIIFSYFTELSDSAIRSCVHTLLWFPCSLILPNSGFTLLQSGKVPTQTCFLKQLPSFFFSFLHFIGNTCVGETEKVFENETLHIFIRFRKGVLQITLFIFSSDPGPVKVYHMRQLQMFQKVEYV